VDGRHHRFRTACAVVRPTVAADGQPAEAQSAPKFPVQQASRRQSDVISAERAA
jgi:hypothetical protein